MTTLDLAQALKLADYVAPLPNGKLQEAGAMLRTLASEVERLRAQVAPEGTRRVSVELLKECVESIDDYRAGVDFGSSDRKLLGALKAVINAAPAAPAITPESGSADAPQAPAITPESAPAQQAEGHYCQAWGSCTFCARCGADMTPGVQQAEPVPTGKMTAQRAKFFLMRFRGEEAMLGPNEQAALAYAVAALEREQYGDAQPPAQGVDERAAFEAWAKASAFARDRLNTGVYAACDTEWCWQAWQARAAIAQAPAADAQWQPIETAPKDGRDLLLWESGSSVPVVAGWRDGRRPGWHASREHYNTDGDACVVDTLWQEGITHWMPIPPAPAA